MVNGKKITKSSYQLKEGDQVFLKKGIKTKDEKPEIIDPVDLKLEVLYEDDNCLVINKPAGIAVHPGNGMKKGEKTIINGMAFLLKERSIPFAAGTVLVHRLDKETTGCLLIAKKPQAHRFLQKQFKDRMVEKTYLAIVAGVPKISEATIEAPIGRNLTNRTKMSVLKTSVSRAASTSYKVLDASDDCALLSCGLHTGRTHQIRVHLSSIGHPVLGDEVYGSAESKKITRKHQINGLCLHAYKLVFKSEKERAIINMPPEKFRENLEKTGLLINVK